MLLRTIGNLPNVMCLEEETYLFMNSKAKASSELRRWDKDAMQRGFSYWVEKTPKHVTKINNILRSSPNASFVFIIRDGRDVMISLQERGYSLKDAISRWVKDNSHVLQYLKNENFLFLKFEEFFRKRSVLKSLKQIVLFLGIEASADRLTLALNSPTAPMVGDQRCKSYSSEPEKVTDLRKAAMLKVESNTSYSVVPPHERKKGLNFHRVLRRIQLSANWMPVQPRWPTEATIGQLNAFWANDQAKHLMFIFYNTTYNYNTTEPFNNS